MAAGQANNGHQGLSPRDLTKELLADLRRIDAKIKTNEGQMRALAATTTTLPQVHGIGIVLAAMLLGAMSSPVGVGAEDLGADPLCVLDLYISRFAGDRFNLRYWPSVTQVLRNWLLQRMAQNGPGKHR